MSERAIAMNNRVLDHQETLDMQNRVNFTKLATELAETSKNFYSRGWVLGTSGNFSAVTSWQPLRLAISSTGLDKDTLTPAHFLEIDGGTNVIRGDGQPSTEALLHLEIIRSMNAGAVLHTHSVWSTVLSTVHASQGGLTLEGYEMLKGLAGVRTHDHHEWLPILDNNQDTTELSHNVSTTLQKHSGIHGFLLRGHGLYSWGASLQAAKRHIEVLEFLMEVLVRSTRSGILGELD
jgi:methylthioribulose-1-phosphate dehydratase